MHGGLGILNRSRPRSCPDARWLRKERAALGGGGLGIEDEVNAESMVLGTYHSARSSLC